MPMKSELMCCKRNCLCGGIPERTIKRLCYAFNPGKNELSQRLLQVMPSPFNGFLNSMVSVLFCFVANVWIHFFSFNLIKISALVVSFQFSFGNASCFLDQSGCFTCFLFSGCQGSNFIKFSDNFVVNSKIYNSVMMVSSTVCHW